MKKNEEKTTTVYTRLQVQTKKNLEEAARNLGVSLPTYIRLCLEKFPKIASFELSMKKVS